MNLKTKLRAALGSLKDHTSIVKAAISSGSNILSDLEIAFVRGTDHRDVPINDKYLHEILFLVSNAPGSINYLARRISSRLETTRDPVVALKTLVLLHRLLRGGDRYFEQDLRKLLSTSDLRMNLWWLSKDPDHICSFILNYSSFLQERMGWIIDQAGKLEPVKPSSSEFQSFDEEKAAELILHRLSKCQLFLDRVMDCFPVNISRSSRVIPSTMNVILKESFRVYSSFCEAAEIVMNSSSNFRKPMRVRALDILKRASIQSHDLHEFYEKCKSSIVGKSLDYPSVRTITITQISAMEQYDFSASRISEHIWTGKTREEENTGQEAEGETYEASTTLLSCKLETKVSKVWVEFDGEDSITSSFAGDLLTDQGKSLRTGKAMQLL